MQVSDLDIEPLQLGSESELFGIRTTPANSRSRYGVIILNAGLLHNVGPFRLHVDLSVELAKLGLPVIRIDQSGKGESPARSALDRYETILQDYDDAFGALRELGASEVILVGLCSGADDSLRIAEKRSSVAGIVMLDGYARKTTRFKFQHYGSKLLSAKTVGRAVTRRAREILGGSANGSDENSIDIDIRDWLGHDEMCALISELLGNKVRILAVFSKGQDYYNHLGQLGDALDRGSKLSNLQEIFFETANHTYSATAHRARLIRDISKWTGEHFIDSSAE